ncbi:sensor histidine kinase [Leptothrix discophora]|uniref:histidine kinase n=1 Tax=Leptothrix discophora TaxID=89 RepID=A0ABT9FZY2_LEPDI|nr:sensor histidine kinase [Leptothrix discophora]MDP4299789.1 sensor histidine kinase N-terminal domain-containing protein [Leptothrix discophora]
MRSRLLAGVLLPVVLLMTLNTWSLYREALRAADLAYDRTLLASAKTIGELLDIGPGATPEAGPQLRATVPYAALEAFEADNRSRMYFKVTGFSGEMVSGFEDLPAWHGQIPMRGPYAALVDFYDDTFRGEPVRVAVLLQPVAGQAGQGMATVQVAETLELRQTLARAMLWSTLWRQLLLLAVISAVVSWVVQRATLPVRALSAAIEARPADDLSALPVGDAPRELQPLITATNDVMARLAGLLARQKRFIRDASHQLRTPLAVLKTQVQSALRGDVPPGQALAEIGVTVDGATRLANQLLALAKLEQARHDQPPEALDLAALVRDVALDLAPLIAEKALEFELLADRPVPVHTQAWMVRELVRNLLHNALRATPRGGGLRIEVGPSPSPGFVIRDSGPGLSPAQRERLFEAFHSGSQGGSGLGLHICREIATQLGATLALDDRLDGDGRVIGLSAGVSLPG